MVDRGVGGWRGLPEGGSGGKQKEVHAGFKHWWPGRGCGEATVEIVSRGQLDTWERCPRETGQTDLASGKHPGLAGS